MVRKMQKISARWMLPGIGMYLLALFAFAQPAAAINQLPIPEPQPGAYGLAATKTQAPPTQGATITTPGNGGSFSTSPITVAGICPTDLLVQVYNNGVMVGSAMCTGGSFTLQVSLFAGINELSAVVYDDLEQAGPTSNIVTVNYADTSLSAFGQLITLTSSYGRRAAAANTELNWPLQLTGGTGPYAFSLDWGDGSSAELKSQSLAGLVTIAHVYKKAGVYQVNAKVSDVNGVSAFLQVIAVASGKVDAGAVNTANAGGTGASGGVQGAAIAWATTAGAVIMMVPVFFLGRMSQVVSLRMKMLKERDAYQQD